VGNEDFDEIVEVGYFEDPCEEFSVEGVQGDSQGHLVLLAADAGVDNKVDYFLVLFVLLRLGLGSAALNVLLDALIDQDLRKLVLSSPHVELSGCPEGVLEGLIVVVEVEVEFGEEEGNKGLVWEGGVLVEILDEVNIVGDVDPVQGDVRQQFAHSDLFELVVFLLKESPVCRHCVDHSSHSNIF
jgi:hypothetical protein